MEFWQLFRMVRQNWLMIAILTVVCIVISLGLNLTKVTLYESSALLRVSFSTVNPLEPQPDYETKFTLFGTIQEAATSDLTLRTVAEKNKINADNLKQLRLSIKVLPVNKSEFLKITATAPSEKQAIGIVNDLAVSIKDSSNKRWLDQLGGILSYNEDQLKITKANFDQSNQNYEDAKKKYKELEDKAIQDDADSFNQKIKKAEEDLSTAKAELSQANAAIPKDQAAVDLAKSKQEKAQKDVDNLRGAAFASIDVNRQAQRNAELNQQSGQDDALNKQKVAKAKVDELQGQIDLAKSLQKFPDLHTASVTIVDQAVKAESQGSGLTLFVGLAVAVALTLGVVLTILMNYLDRGIYSVSAARELYKQPVLAGIPNFGAAGKGLLGFLKKGGPKTKGKGKDKAKTSTDPVVAPVSVNGNELPEYVMESFRMLANSVVERHIVPAATLASPKVLVPAIVTAGLDKTDSATEQTEPAAKNGNGHVNGNGSSNLALSELSEVNGLTVRADDPAYPLNLLVAASTVGAGKTTVVSNLGMALAEAGYRTLLIDCNRKNPVLLDSFGLNGHNGKGTDKAKDKNKDKAKKDESVPEVTNSAVDEPGRIYNTVYPELDILPYSSLPTQASGVVRPNDMAALLQKVSGNYQLMICDSPALDEAADAVGLVQHFPNILYVVNGEKPKVISDQEKLQSLTNGSAVLEGVIINRLQKREA